jgi:hypothetical protein
MLGLVTCLPNNYLQGFEKYFIPKGGIGGEGGGGGGSFQWTGNRDQEQPESEFLVHALIVRQKRVIICKIAASK